MPVGRHVVEADAPADGAHARRGAAAGQRRGRARRPRTRVDRVVEGVRIDRSRSPSGSRARRARGRRRTRARGGCRRGRPATRPRTGPPARAAVANTTSCSRVISSGSSSPIPRASFARPRAGREHDAVALDELAADAHAAHARRPRPRSPRPPCPRAPRARRGAPPRRTRRVVATGIGEARVGLEERVRDPGAARRPAGTRAGRRPRRCRRPPRPASIEFSAAAERRLRVDEEEPAAARVDRLAVEVERQLAQPFARADGHPHHLGVRVVAAHDRRRLAGRGLAEAAGLEQQRLHALARELPQRRRAEDPAADRRSSRRRSSHRLDRVVGAVALPALVCARDRVVVELEAVAGRVVRGGSGRPRASGAGPSVSRSASSWCITWLPSVRFGIVEATCAFARKLISLSMNACRFTRRPCASHEERLLPEAVAARRRRGCPARSRPPPPSRAPRAAGRS